MLNRKHFAIPYALFLLSFVVVPLVLIVVYSFTTPDWHFTFANYKKIFISAPSEQFSLAEDKYVLACYVQFESFSEAGYIEVDWHKKESGYVALSKLIDYVDAKGVKRRKTE